MSEQFENVTLSPIKSWEEGTELMEKLFDAAKPEAVFGEPVTAEGQTIITAAEVSVGMGFGFGMGSGPAGETEDEGDQAGGAVGGGGGGAGSRPVAVSRSARRGFRWSRWWTSQRSPSPFSPLSAVYS